MNLIEFHLRCMRTNIPSPNTSGLLYSSNALNGEAGEFANFIKKLYRDHDGIMNEEIKTEMQKELFDCMWYICDICDKLGLTLDDLSRCGKFEELEKRYKLK